MEEYWNLRIYIGPVVKCSHCGRPFKYGDVVSMCIELTRELVFCYPSETESCLLKYMLEKKSTILAAARPFVFRGHRR